ncbi:YitT family protein [uncultured Ruminococcus sp.]|uniref:YitT family protein n=1 Tax=uncultured Ruminococcus sp. TaxID=165186 RepID=UPI002587A681|nr:YitT family protein [uncultured Ruminococcus sp.]
MRNKKKLWAALHFLMITVGTFVYSVALEMFLVPNLVLDGGLTGISLMINYQTGILLGLLTFLLNIPFVVLGWRMLGLRFAGSYLYAMILLSGFTALLHDVAPVTDNELLSVVFGGILLGIGVGLVIKGGACLDGTELLAMLCSKRLPVSVGQVILFLNLVIFSVAACLFGIDRALLSLLTYIIASKLIDMVETGFNEAKQTIIICNDGATIATEIYEKLGRTMTILDAHGLISGKKDMMYCVITRLELMELRRIVEKYDGSAFITISDISEIIGDHIKKTSKVQQEVIAQQMEQREKAFAESEE